MKSLIVIALIIVVLVIVFVSKDSFDEKRQKNVSDMEELINQAKLAGDYKCCINPPCKMCYLGNWIWDDGKCNCDGEMIKGNWDNVCPECKKGMEKGECESDLAPGTCIIN